MNPGRESRGGNNIAQRSSSDMAAERAPSRRKQCIFRRAFQRFPFGKCERKSRNNSSYDVFSKDGPQQIAETWSPKGPALSSLGSRHTLPLDSVTSAVGCGRTPLPYTDPTQDSHLIYESNGVPPSFPDGNQNAVPARCPSGSLGGHHSDSVPFSHHTSGLQDLAPECSPVTAPGEEDSACVALPPSPSISSMETDVEVDPETGERAMD